MRCVNQSRGEQSPFPYQLPASPCPSLTPPTRHSPRATRHSVLPRPPDQLEEEPRSGSDSLCCTPSNVISHSTINTHPHPHTHTHPPCCATSAAGSAATSVGGTATQVVAPTTLHPPSRSLAGAQTPPTTTTTTTNRQRSLFRGVSSGRARQRRRTRVMLVTMVLEKNSMGREQTTTTIVTASQTIREITTSPSTSPSTFKSLHRVQRRPTIHEHRLPRQPTTRPRHQPRSLRLSRTREQDRNPHIVRSLRNQSFCWPVGIVVAVAVAVAVPPPPTAQDRVHTDSRYLQARPRCPRNEARRSP